MVNLCLSHAEVNNYFEITEIWFRYEKSKYLKTLGIGEGEIIYINSNDGKFINVTADNQNINFTYDEGLDIYGHIMLKKDIKYKIKKR